MGFAFASIRRGIDQRPVLAIALALYFMALPLHSVAQQAAAQPLTVILVRHADKAAEPRDDPPLTAAGAQRAQDLAKALHDAGVTQIFTTQLRRTRETAQVLANELRVTPEVVSVERRALVPNPPANAQFPPEVAQARNEYIRILEDKIRHLSGAKVLVVGHDWSVPGLIAALGGPKLSDICSSVYDNLFVLTLSKKQAHLIKARYGEATPDTGCK